MQLPFKNQIEMTPSLGHISAIVHVHKVIIQEVTHFIFHRLTKVDTYFENDLYLILQSKSPIQKKNRVNSTGELSVWNFFHQQSRHTNSLHNT